jgi:hypothetical protein
VPPYLETSDLAGQQDVPIPAGRWDLTFILSRELNGRTLLDQRTVPVRGFADGDTWAFQLTATCLNVDGVGQWAAELSLASAYISNSLRVTELVANGSGPSSWSVRTPGVPDLAYGPAATTQPTPSHPVFNRSWLVFQDAPGCAGTPPTFHLEFPLTCGG